MVPHYDGRWYLFATCHHKITTLKSQEVFSFHFCKVFSVLLSFLFSLFLCQHFVFIKSTTLMVHLELSRSLTAEHPVRVVGEVDSDGRGGSEKNLLFSMLKAFKQISVFFCFNRFLLSNLLFVMLVLVSRFLMWLLLFFVVVLRCSSSNIEIFSMSFLFVVLPLFFNVVLRCLRPRWWPSGACWRIKVGKCG